MKLAVAIPLSIFLFAMVLSGCSLLAGSNNGSEPVDLQTLQLLLEAHWDLMSLGEPENLQEPLAGTQITLEFSSEGDGTSGTVTGSAGCNQYGGSYEITASALTISDIYLTRIFCSEPEGVMDQEMQFVSALQSVTGYHMSGGRLNLSYGPGNATLFWIGALP